jgi:predicted NUDIX family NTP pyrophosphohydrolase
MAKISAGILLYRRSEAGPEVFLVHPGGPFWRNKDLGAWTIPKGEPAAGEALLACAKREFAEETGIAIAGRLRALAPIRQAGGKQVHAWAVEGAADPAAMRSNSFVLEWPPRSGRMQAFPEADRAGWFPLAEARRKILKSQLPLLEQLAALLEAEG